MLFEESLELARKGDEQAWRTIYSLFARPVIGYLRSRGAAEPEDLAGEVFLQIVRDIGRFQGGESEMRSWIFTIAHHRLLDEARSRKRKPVVVAPKEVIEAGAPVGDAESEAFDAIEGAEVRRLLDGLTRDQRDVLTLRLVGGLKIEEIARVLGKRSGAVQALQRRGLESLKREISRRNVRF